MCAPGDSGEARNEQEKTKGYPRRIYAWFRGLTPNDKFTLLYVTFTAIYAVATILLYFVTKESADANVATVRAWVYPIDIDPPAPDKLAKNREMPIKLLTGGKTPATEIIITEELKFWARSARKPIPEFTRCERGRYLSQPYKYGPIGADKMTGWLHPPIEKIDATPEELNRLSALKDGLFLHACIEYRTVTGDRGLTEYCTVAYGADLKATAPCLHNAMVLK